MIPDLDPTKLKSHEGRSIYPPRKVSEPLIIVAEWLMLFIVILVIAWLWTRPMDIPDEMKIHNHGWPDSYEKWNTPVGEFYIKSNGGTP